MLYAQEKKKNKAAAKTSNLYEIINLISVRIFMLKTLEKREFNNCHKARSINERTQDKKTPTKKA